MAQAYVNFIQNSPFQDYTVNKLRELARTRKIKYYYKLKKVDLVIALENFNNNTTTPILNNITNTQKNIALENNTKDKDITVVELREFARVLLVKNSSKLRKAELITAIENTLENSTNTKKIKPKHNFRCMLKKGIFNKKPKFSFNSDVQTNIDFNVPLPTEPLPTPTEMESFLGLTNILTEHNLITDQHLLNDTTTEETVNSEILTLDLDLDSSELDLDQILAAPTDPEEIEKIIAEILEDEEKSTTVVEESKILNLDFTKVNFETAPSEIDRIIAEAVTLFEEDFTKVNFETAPTEIDRIIAEAVTSFEEEEDFGLSSDDDISDDFSDSDYNALNKLHRFIRTDIPEYKPPPPPPIQPVKVHPELQKLFDQLEREGKISLYHPPKSAEEIQKAAPGKYPKVQVKRYNTLKTNIGDVTEYVNHKPTRPKPLDFGHSRPEGRFAFPHPIPKINVTPSPADYTNTVEIDMDPFLTELLGEVEEKPTFAVEDRIIAELLAEMELSEEEEETPKSKVYYGAGNLGKMFPFENDVFSTNIKNRLKLKYVNIHEIFSEFNKKFNTRTTDLKISIKKNLPEEKVNVIDKILNEIIVYSKNKYNFKEGDKINIVVEHPGFFNSISTGYNCPEPIKKLKDKITQILSSDESVNILDCTFRVHIVSIQRGASGAFRVINLVKDKRTKKSVVQIKNNDNLCCPRAIVVGLSYFSNVILGIELTANKIKQLRIGRNIQTDLAHKLCDMLGNSYNEEGFTLEDIKNCEELLDIQVNVVCSENFNTVIYRGCDKDRKIYLYKQGNHFDLITKMSAFFGSSYFCHKCNKPYNNKNKHNCKVGKKETCVLCMKEQHATESKCKLFCKKCNRYCFNKECLTEHSVTVCPTVYKCIKCCKIVNRSNEHKCGFENCKNCKNEVEITKHRCYMLSKKQKGGRCEEGCSKCFKPTTCIANTLDTVTIVKDNYRKLILEHHPDKGGDKLKFQEVFESYKNVQTLLQSSSLSSDNFHSKEDDFTKLGLSCNCKASIVNTLNDKCTFSDKYIYYDCETNQETGVHVPNLIVAKYQDGTTFTFKTRDEFGEWLISKEHKDYTAIAHYARGFDSQFVLQYCIKNTVQPYTIYCGSKLMLLEISALNLKVIDSHNFIQSPLSAFPKTFGLTELKKGYFPHLFNTVENENYIGPIPDKKYYCYDTMSTTVRKDFVKWHTEKVAENYIFDLQKELLEYCNSDVDILRRGCIEFRNQFLEIANIDPFQYLTIPSVCMAIYRSKYLQPNTIGIFEQEQKDQYSKISVSWLKSFNNENIKHAMNGGEVKICGSKVDGYDETTKSVYQFNGCFWHGCPKCYHEDTVNNVKKETMGDILTKTKERTEFLEGAGYTVISVWECEWKKSREYKTVAKKTEIIEPLNPRDAFFGGRTEAFKLKVDDPNKKIKYIDVCSLYPTVMFYDDYPIAHPTKIIKPNYYDYNWFGLIKCKVVAPKNLYVPVLPVKVKMCKAEKLVFPLCLKCAENQQSTCSHTESERAFVGTWSSVEVNKALEMGYIVDEIYEVWQLEKSKELWKGYVRDFMKIKLESSPHNYPSKEAYAAAVKQKERIELDLDKIDPNPGKRAVAKLCLNSLWGKFGQRSNMTKVEQITDPCRFYQILLDDTLSDIHVFFLSETMLQVNYKYKTEFVQNNFNTNIFVAIYTTANARLRLYEQLSKLDKAVIYADTDSVFYLDDDTNTVQTGDCLGEWTDELGQGAYIEKFLSSGPKSYYFRTNAGKECTKVKGFSLNHRNAEKINSEALEKLITGEVESVTVINNQITRERETKQLVNKEAVKTLSFTFDKRVIQPDHDTLPFGYVRT